MQHLVPSMQHPEGWDVFIGHYLGVDHVGHTYNIHSHHMRQKLHQMDQQIMQACPHILLAYLGGCHAAVSQALSSETVLPDMPAMSCCFDFAQAAPVELSLGNHLGPIGGC